MRGFQRHFHERPAEPANQWALVSFGDTMRTTRFFFADAAVQSARFQMDPDNSLVQQTNAVISQVNEVLRNLVQSYLTVRQREMQKSRR
jgi:hypothetical protein